MLLPLLTPSCWQLRPLTNYLNRNNKIWAVNCLSNWLQTATCARVRYWGCRRRRRLLELQEYLSKDGKSRYQAVLFHFGRIFACSFANRLRKFSQDVFIYPGEIYLSSLNPKVLRGEIGGQWAWHNWAAENICSLTCFGILHPSSATPKTSMYFASPVGNYL